MGRGKAQDRQPLKLHAIESVPTVDWQVRRERLKAFRERTHRQDVNYVTGPPSRFVLATSHAKEDASTYVEQLAFFDGVQDALFTIAVAPYMPFGINGLFDLGTQEDDLCRNITFDSDIQLEVPPSQVQRSGLEKEALIKEVLKGIQSNLAWSVAGKPDILDLSKGGRLLWVTDNQECGVLRARVTYAGPTATLRRYQILRAEPYALRATYDLEGRGAQAQKLASPLVTVTCLHEGQTYSATVPV